MAGDTQFIPDVLDDALPAHVPVWCANDAEAAALGSLQMTELEPYSRYLVLTCGFALGAALVYKEAQLMSNVQLNLREFQRKTFSLPHLRPPVTARALNGTTWSVMLETTFTAHPDRDGGGIPSTFTASSLTNAAGLHIQFTAKANRRYRLEASDTLTGWTVIRTRNPRTTDTAVDWLLTTAELRRFLRAVAEP